MRLRHDSLLLAATGIVLLLSAAPASAQSNGTERGLIKWNGNNVGAGQSVTCLHGGGATTTTTEVVQQYGGRNYNYNCVVENGGVNLQYNGQTSPACPTCSGSDCWCDAAVTGCSNPTVTMSSIFALPAIVALPGTFAGVRALQRLDRRLRRRLKDRKTS